MKLKSTFTTILAFVLVAISCASTACSAACDLKSQSGGCHPSGAPSSDQMMVGLNHCPMDSSVSQTSFHLVVLEPNDGPCHEHHCHVQSFLAEIVTKAAQPSHKGVPYDTSAYDTSVHAVPRAADSRSSMFTPQSQPPASPSIPMVLRV